MARPGRRSTSSWLAFDLPAFTVALAAATTTGLPRLVARRPAARVFARAGAHLRLGSDRCAVIAEATEASGTRLRRAVTGRREAHVTALVAARVADAVLAGTVPVGVHHMEQVVDPDTFLGELSAADPDLKLFDAETTAPPRP